MGRNGFHQPDFMHKTGFILVLFSLKIRNILYWLVLYYVGMEKTFPSAEIIQLLISAQWCAIC